jgi:C4-dicarboxylate transporter DctQ subunit
MTSDTGEPSGSAGQPQTTGRDEGAGIDRLFDMLASVSSFAATILCGVLIVVTSFSVVVYQRGITISWLDDLLRLLLIWLVFLGSVSGVWRRDHITMDALYTRFGPVSRRLVDMLVAVMGIVICGFVTWVSLETTMREREFSTLLASGELLAWPQTLAIPVSFGLMTLAYVGVLIATLAGRSVAPPPPGAGT